MRILVVFVIVKFLIGKISAEAKIHQQKIGTLGHNYQNQLAFQPQRVKL